MEEYKLFLKKEPEGKIFHRVHAVLVMPDGRVLLRYKDNEARLTGGHIEPTDADIVAALKREILEELNCEVDRCDYLGYLEVDMEIHHKKNGCSEITPPKEYWARMVARVSEVLPPRADPDRDDNWIYGRTLASPEVAKTELIKSAPMGDTDKLVNYALKVAREKEYFTELPSAEYEVLNVETHD